MKSIYKYSLAGAIILSSSGLGFLYRDSLQQISVLDVFEKNEVVQGVTGTPTAQGVTGTPTAQGVTGTPTAQGVTGTPTVQSEETPTSSLDPAPVALTELQHIA